MPGLGWGVRHEEWGVRCTGVEPYLDLRVGGRDSRGLLRLLRLLSEPDRGVRRRGIRRPR